jgi:cytochrome c oxidase cbb3-type subunit III
MRALIASLVVAMAWCSAHLDAAQDRLTLGRTLFLEHCASCHGPDGQGGRGPVLAVRKLRTAASDEDIAWIVENGSSGSIMQGFALPQDDIKLIVAWVRKLGDTPSTAAPGSVDRGGLLYQGKGGCVRCHALKGFGEAIGPDLTDVGARRTITYLRTSLTDPEADVQQTRTFDTARENFLFVSVEIRGRRIEGVRVNEDAFSILVRDMSGELHSLGKADISSLTKQWGKSPMPSYRTVLSEQELDDLVAFLASQRGEL